MRRNVGVLLLLLAGSVGYSIADGRSLPIAAASALAAQGPATPMRLRIVVLEGEGAVNIIERMTAVAPVVEVRDSNDLPISGAAVLFLLGGRNATFSGGGRQVSLVTDALGRARASLTATGKGTLNIQVRATFQNQAATATIHQTNFATVADAAKAGKAVSESGTTAGASGTSAAGTAAGAAGAGAAAAGGVSAAVIGGTIAAVGQRLIDATAKMMIKRFFEKLAS